MSTGGTAADPFSDRLEAWLAADERKTLGELDEVFAAKAFAVTIMFLMFVPALPLPTGGITHVFEVIVVLLGAEMVAGAKTIWLPAKWRDREIGGATTMRALPIMARRIRWFERFARPRGRHLLGQGWFVRLLGLVLITFAVAAGFAPPFSGLDTLPAMGAVAVALGIVLDDVVFVGIGVVLGTAGIALALTIGSAVVHLIKNLFA